MKGWAWENSWLLYSLAGNVLVPWMLAGGTVRNIPEVLSVSHLLYSHLAVSAHIYVVLE